MASDDFDRSNASTLGANWDQLNDRLGITSNQAYPVSDGIDWATYSTDLGGADQDVSVSVYFGTYGAGQYQFAGPVARASNSAQTGYQLVLGRGWNDPESGLILNRFVTGTATAIGTSWHLTPDYPTVVRLTTSGSTITAYVNGEQKIQVTDTGVTTGNYAGVFSETYNSSSLRFDSWSATGPVDPDADITATVVAATAAVDVSGWATRNSLIVMGGESRTGTWS